MKKLLALLLVGIMMLSSISVFAVSEVDSTEMTKNSSNRQNVLIIDWSEGYEVGIGCKPVKKKDAVLVSLKEFMVMTDYIVISETDKSVKISNGNREITITAQSKNAYIEDKQITLDNEIYEENKLLYINLEDIEKLFSYDVSYDSKNNNVVLKVTENTPKAVKSNNTAAYGLKMYGIMNGDPDGNMRLEDTITRAEATALIVRLYKEYGKNVVLENIKFEDLEGHWAYNEIEYAKCANLIDGTSETTFEPERNVTVQEFAKMVISLIGYKEMAEQRGGFPHGYIMTASSLGLFTEITTKTDDSALRGDVAIMLALALDIPIMQIKKEPEGFNYEDSVAYEILDGKNGMEYVTLRTLLEGNSDVPRFNGPEYTGRILQISELKATKDGYTFKNSLNEEDKSTYIVNGDTYIYLSENTVELSEIKDNMYAQCWYYTDDKDNIELLKIELMKEKPSGI